MCRSVVYSDFRNFKELFDYQYATVTITTEVRKFWFFKYTKVEHIPIFRKPPSYQWWHLFTGQYMHNDIGLLYEAYMARSTKLKGSKDE